MHLEIEESEQAIEGRELGELTLGDLTDVDGVLEASKSASKTVRVLGESCDDVENGAVNATLDTVVDGTIHGGSNFCVYISLSSYVVI
jgi:hypothetical protein